MKILLIEKDVVLGKEIKIKLETSGYDIIWVKQNEEIVRTYELNEFVGVVVNINDQEVSKLINQIREKDELIPILTLTTSEDIKLLDLEKQEKHEDIVVKKFDLDEVSSKLKNLIYQVTLDQKQSIIMDIGSKTLILNPVLRRVQYNGKTVELSRKELLILTTLIENVGKVLSSDFLQDTLYKIDQDIDSNTIQVYVYNIRKKIDKDLIRTIHGSGYIVDPK